METSKKKIVGDELVKIEVLLWKSLKDMNLSTTCNSLTKVFYPPPFSVLSPKTSFNRFKNKSSDIETI
jgi:hypothetical protein